jgi:hypothetical protein
LAGVRELVLCPREEVPALSAEGLPAPKLYKRLCARNADGDTHGKKCKVNNICCKASHAPDPEHSPPFCEDCGTFEFCDMINSPDVKIWSTQYIKTERENGWKNTLGEQEHVLLTGKEICERLSERVGCYTSNYWDIEFESAVKNKFMYSLKEHDYYIQCDYASVYSLPQQDSKVCVSANTANCEVYTVHSNLRWVDIPAYRSKGKEYPASKKPIWDMWVVYFWSPSLGGKDKKGSNSSNHNHNMDQLIEMIKNKVLPEHHDLIR